MQILVFLGVAVMVARTVAVAGDTDSQRRILASSTGVELRDSPVRVPLQRGADLAELSRLSPDERVYLVISDLQTDRQPGVSYDVFFNMPPNTVPSRLDRYLAGNLNFFSVRPGSKKASNFASFDVTDAARTTLRAVNPKALPTVTVMPTGKPAVDSHPLLGRIELVVLRVH